MIPVSLQEKVNDVFGFLEPPAATAPEKVASKPSIRISSFARDPALTPEKSHNKPNLIMDKPNPNLAKPNQTQDKPNSAKSSEKVYARFQYYFVEAGYSYSIVNSNVLYIIHNTKSDHSKVIFKSPENLNILTVFKGK